MADFIASDGREFGDEESWQRYEKILSRIPACALSPVELKQLTTLLFQFSFDTNGRPGVGLEFVYHVRSNKMLSGYNEEGFYSPAADIAVEVFAAPGSFDRKRANLETVLFYTLTGTGDIIVIPYAPELLEPLPESWNEKIYPHPPALSVRGLNVFAEKIKLYEKWNPEERPLPVDMTEWDWKVFHDVIIKP